MIQKLRAGIQSILIGEEELQQPVFGRADVHRDPIDQNSMLVRNQGDAPGFNAIQLFKFAASSEDRADTGYQFARGKGFGNVVIKPSA